MLGTRVITLLFLQDCSNHFNSETFLELQSPHKISRFLLCELYTHLCKHIALVFFISRGRLHGVEKLELCSQNWRISSSI